MSKNGLWCTPIGQNGTSVSKTALKRTPIGSGMWLPTGPSRSAVNGAPGKLVFWGVYGGGQARQALLLLRLHPAAALRVSTMPPAASLPPPAPSMPAFPPASVPCVPHNGTQGTFSAYIVAHVPQFGTQDTPIGADSHNGAPQIIRCKSALWNRIRGRICLCLAKGCHG